MSKARRHADVSVYLPHAVIATAAVVMFPIAFILGALAVGGADADVLAPAFFALALSVGACIVGSIVWRRHPESVDLSFSELMLWTWYRRKKAEERLAQGELMVTGRNGQAPRRLQMSRQERLVALEGLISALEVKDPYTHGHSRRVSKTVRRIARQLGLTPAEIEVLTRAATLHDVGKIRLSTRVIRKPGPLSADERAQLEDHTLVGAWIVAGLGSEDITMAVRSHHERWDGLGYPDGFSGEEIHLFARIIAVADAFDAMTSTRPYRAGLGRDEATEVIRNEAGSQFDPVVVEAFLETVPSHTRVLALFPFLIGPRRIARAATAWARNTGATALAPAATAAGAAVVIGTSALVSPGGTDQGPRVLSERVQTSTADADDKGGGNANAADAKENGGRDERGKGLGRGKGRGPAKDGKVPPQKSSADEATSKPKPSPPIKPSPKSKPTPSPNAASTGDPQPDQGRDCENHPGQGQGGGNDRHCDS